MNAKNKHKGAFKLEKSPVLPENYFSLPLDYFDTLETRITTKLGIGTTKIPENYFETLPDRIFARLNLESPKAENTFHLPDHTGLKKNLFTIPVNYFEELPDRILDLVLESEMNASLSIENGSMSRNLPFNVPAGYFSNLADSLEEKIRLETHPGYSIESETLIVKLTQTSESNHSGNLLKLSPPVKSSKLWMGILLAACLTFFAIYTGVINRNALNKAEKYPILTQEDRLKYRFGVDESVLEDEIVSNGVDIAAVKVLNAEEKSDLKKKNLNDRYLLSHPDASTLLEEL